MTESWAPITTLVSAKGSFPVDELRDQITADKFPPFLNHTQRTSAGGRGAGRTSRPQFFLLLLFQLRTQITHQLTYLNTPLRADLLGHSFGRSECTLGRAL